MTERDRFIAQAQVAETNLIRLALKLEELASGRDFVKDLANECIVTSHLLRDSRQAFHHTTE